MTQTPPYRIFPLGQDGVLLRFGTERTIHPALALALAARAQATPIPGVTEIASSLGSVMVRFAPEVTNRAEVAAALFTLMKAPEAPAAPTRLWTIPACFGGDHGPQLAEVARLANITPDAAVTDLTATDLTVLAIGFAPGQPYLGTLPPVWALERQQALTPQVPAGAIVVALRQVVLFANPSPTGWRWVGACAFRPFVADRAAPFALGPGDRVRFALTDASTLAGLHTAPDGLGGATCTVAR